MIYGRTLIVLVTVAILARGGSIGAACGWYLLEPPLLENRPTEEDILRQSPQWRGMSKPDLRDIVAAYWLDRDSPLGQWTHKGSFDTTPCARKHANACSTCL